MYAHKYKKYLFDDNYYIRLFSVYFINLNIYNMICKKYKDHFIFYNVNEKQST